MTVRQRSLQIIEAVAEFLTMFFIFGALVAITYLAMVAIATH